MTDESDNIIWNQRATEPLNIPTEPTVRPLTVAEFNAMCQANPNHILEIDVPYTPLYSQRHRVKLGSIRINRPDTELSD